MDGGVVVLVEVLDVLEGHVLDILGSVQDLGL